MLRNERFWVGVEPVVGVYDALGYARCLEHADGAKGDPAQHVRIRAGALLHHDEACDRCGRGLFAVGRECAVYERPDRLRS